MKGKFYKVISLVLCFCVIFTNFGVSVKAAIQPIAKEKPQIIAENEFKTPEELKISFEETKKKSDKFIIKFKPNDTKNKIYTKSNILKSKSAKVKHSKEIKTKNYNEEIWIINNTDTEVLIDVNNEEFPTQNEQDDIILQSITLEESVDINDFISNELKANPEIEYIQPDYILEASELAEVNDLISESIEQNQEYPEETIEIELVEIDSSLDTESDDNTDINSETESDDNADINSETESSTENSIDLDINEDVLETTNILEEKEPDKVIVAIIDTGIDITHEDLKDKIYKNESEEINGFDSDSNGFIDDIHGWNFVDDNNVVYQNEGVFEQAHGTHIAGIIAGLSNKDYGVSIDENIGILPLKVFSNGRAYTSDIIDAINYAESMGAKIINCSFGSTSYNPALKEAMEKSSALFVCAAGNGRNNLDEKPVYPAAFGLDNIISVASVNDDGGLSYFSNYGTETVDIAAPGREIKSTLPNGDYAVKTGTSMSAAFVSGTAARVLAYNFGIDAYSIKNQIIDGADKISPLEGFVKDIAMLNSGYAVLGYVNNNKRNIFAEDDFNVTGYSSDSEQMRLFNSSKNIAVAAGDYHNLVLKEDGTVWAWGDNTFGQLGNGEFSDYSDLPVQVMGLTDIIKIDAGETSCMALDSNGDVWTWGGNFYGQLGSYNYSDSPVPMIVITYAKDISMRNHCAVITNGGQLATWGKNDNLQLGWANYYGGMHVLSYSFPGYVMDFFDEALKVSCGNSSTLVTTDVATAIIGNGRISSDWKVGSRGQIYGEVQYILLSSQWHFRPIEISAGTKTNIYLQEDYSVLVFNENTCVNQDAIGGYVSSFEYYAPNSLPYPNYLGELEFENATKIHASMSDTYFVLLEDGSVYVCGENRGGTFGDGSEFGVSEIPALVNIDANIVDIYGGGQHVVALADNGDIWGWGTNLYGVLGANYTNNYQPMKIFNNDDFGVENNPFANAINISDVNGTFEANGTIGPWSDSIYYSITPNKTGEYQFNITPTEYISQMNLYDNTHNFLEMRLDMTADLIGGETYYIEISALGSETEAINFTLSIKNRGLFTLNAENSKAYTFVLSASNMKSFNDRVFKLEYDQSKLQVIDLACQTQKGTTSAGKIEGTDITIISNTNGVITFKFDKQIPEGKNWSGTLSVIKLKALSSGESNISAELL